MGYQGEITEHGQKKYSIIPTHEREEQIKALIK